MTRKAYLCTAFRGKHHLSLDYGVMVAQQVLVLFVQVRILVVQLFLMQEALSDVF